MKRRKGNQKKRKEIKICFVIANVVIIVMKIYTLVYKIFKLILKIIDFFSD